MKLLVYLTCFAALVLSGCVTSQSTAARQSADQVVAAVCESTGLQPVGPVKKITPPSKSQAAERIECRLSAEGHTYTYFIHRSPDGKIKSFMPQDGWAMATIRSTAWNAVDDTLRDRCDASAQRIARKFGWKLYGFSVPPIFQSGPNYVLTYFRVPKGRAERMLTHFDLPVKPPGTVENYGVTRAFLVTPKGTVLASWSAYVVPDAKDPNMARLIVD